MKQRGEKVLRNSPWVAVAVLTAALVAAAAAGRSEGRRPAVAENSTIEANVAETTMVGETLPTTADSRSTDPRAVANRPADPGTSVLSTAAGVRAFVDPETGELTANPTRAQLQRQVAQQRAASSLSRSTSGLRPFELSRGGRGLNLQGRFQTAMRVERAADGSFHMTCGDGHEDGHSHDHSEPTAAVPVQ